MIGEHETPNELMGRLTRELRLACSDSHDWGIVNADATRVEEFLVYFLANQLKVDHKRRDLFVYAMTELIVESVFSCIQSVGGLSDAGLKQFRLFWSNVRDHHAGEMELEGIRHMVGDAIDGRHYRRLLEYLEETV